MTRPARPDPTLAALARDGDIPPAFMSDAEKAQAEAARHVRPPVCSVADRFVRGKPGGVSAVWMNGRRKTVQEMIDATAKVGRKAKR